MRNRLLLLTVMLTLTAIAHTAYSQDINSQYTAFIDNKCFELNPVTPVTAIVVEPAAVQDGASAKTIVHIQIKGKDDGTDALKGSESIELSLALTEPICEGPAGIKVAMVHKGIAYSIVKDDGSNVEITDFIWSRDRKSFMLSLSFNCTMRNPAFLAVGGKDLKLKGKLLRMQVRVPGTTSASN